MPVTAAPTPPPSQPIAMVHPAVAKLMAFEMDGDLAKGSRRGDRRDSADSVGTACSDEGNMNVLFGSLSPESPSLTPRTSLDSVAGPSPTLPCLSGLLSKSTTSMATSSYSLVGGGESSYKSSGGTSYPSCRRRVSFAVNPAAMVVSFDSTDPATVCLERKMTSQELCTEVPPITSTTSSSPTLIASTTTTLSSHPVLGTSITSTDSTGGLFSTSPESATTLTPDGIAPAADDLDDVAASDRISMAEHAEREAQDAALAAIIRCKQVKALEKARLEGIIQLEKQQIEQAERDRKKQSSHRRKVWANALMGNGMSPMFGMYVVWEAEKHIKHQQLLDEYWADQRKRSKGPKNETVNVEGRAARRSWERLVEDVIDITPTQDNELSIGLLWRDGTQSWHPATVVYRKCHQAESIFTELLGLGTISHVFIFQMLQFYEKNLQFRKRAPEQVANGREPDLPSKIQVTHSLGESQDCIGDLLGEPAESAVGPDI
ncbi:hypothetical protein HKX48_006870 [Thoreauomyces humboldtii]|nr:hypothetical protein HKX48_006870 [Thoreauomyces humboldtii]